MELFVCTIMQLFYFAVSSSAGTKGEPSDTRTPNFGLRFSDMIMESQLFC